MLKINIPWHQRGQSLLSFFPFSAHLEFNVNAVGYVLGMY